MSVIFVEVKTPTAEEYAHHSGEFGVNTTNPLKCSMFIDGNLAEICANDFDLT